MDPPESPQGGKCVVKEKKTRRRLRLSCVECTKRRQKCDRNHPCSLCVSRGVAHLCRWETVPLARPAPARPPASALREATLSDQSTVIARLKQRIAVLEDELERAREQSSSPNPSNMSIPPSTDTGGSSTSSPSQLSGQQSPKNCFAECLQRVTDNTLVDLDPFPLDDDAYGVTSTLAQISLAHHGEFIGRGSLLCALHSVTTRKTPRFLYAKSTDAISGLKDPVEKFSDMPFIRTIEELVSSLPSMLVVETLTAAFFLEVNWRYGIPEEWFRGTRSQMWASLQNRETVASRINANWLMLLFAILASAPQSAYKEIKHYAPTRSSDDYFMCAMMARRMVEDEYLCVPTASFMDSAADGTVLGCLATPLLCDYLAQRGLVSEAWKLVGQGIRNALSVGMHRDPEWKLWQMMSADEKLLRRRAWWGLFMSDKTYAYFLSRPQTLRPEVFDVSLSSPMNADGTRNLFNVGQNHIVGLMELLGEAIEKCLSVEFPSAFVYFDMDHKLQEWEARLPPEYQFKSDVKVLPELNLAEKKILARQRYILHTWYLIGRLKLHIASTTGQGRAPQPPGITRRGVEECISLSIELIEFQTAAFDAYTGFEGDLSAPVYPGTCWLFEGCLSLFEASVALVTIMTQLTWVEKVAHANAALDSAVRVFHAVSQREDGKTGETATRALEVLVTIRGKYWQDTGTLVQLPKIKDDPEQVGASLMNLDKADAGSRSLANIYAE